MKISRDQALTHIALSVPILVSEIVTSVNLTSYYTNHEQHFVAAVLLSVAFSVLLAGSTVIVARPQLSVEVRVLLGSGIVLLFVLQGISNVSGSYLTASTHGPVFETLTELWGPSWKKVSSLLFGAGINCIALAYWTALAMSLRAEMVQQEALANLSQFEAKLAARHTEDAA